MNDFVPIPEDIFWGDYLLIDFDPADLDGMLVVVWRVGFELLDKSGQKRLADPPPFGKGPIGKGVGFDETVREPVNVDRFILLVLVLLHLVIVNYFFDKMAFCLK